MLDKVIDFSLLPLNQRHALIIRMRTEHEIRVALCFSQVSTHYCVRQFLHDPEADTSAELELMLDTEQVQILPDFDEHEELMLETPAADALSNLIDQLALCDPATLRPEYARFARRFRSGVVTSLPNNSENHWSLYRPNSVAVIFAKARPYRVSLLYTQADLDELGADMVQASIDGEKYRNILPPYEEVWESALTLDGPAAETVAFLAWLYNNSLKLDEVLARRQP